MAAKEKKQVDIVEEVKNQLKSEEIAPPVTSVPANPVFAPPLPSSRYDDADREFMPNRNDQIFSPNRGGYSGGMGMGMPRPGFPIRGTGDRVLDELLAGVPANEGYYLKLYKELRPNDYELKMRIDHYENWSDMEWEVNEIVRAYTAKLGAQRWGSGRYRVIIYREGGMRGPKFKPIDFQIDAQEPSQAQNAQEASNLRNESLKDQVQSMADMMKAIQSFNPPQDPARLHDTIVNSMKSGAELAAAKETANATVKSAEIQSNATQQGQLVTLMGETIRSLQNKPADTGTAQIIAAMMQQMGELTRMQLNKPPDASMQMAIENSQMVMAKVLESALNKPERKDDSMEKFLLMAKEFGMFQKKEDSIDMLIKFKQAGIIPDAPKPEVNSIEKMVDSFQKMLPLAKAMLGKSDISGETSIWPDVIKTVAPAVAKTVGDVVGTAREYYRMKQMESVAGRPVMAPPPAGGETVVGVSPQVTLPVNRSPQVKPSSQTQGFAGSQPVNFDQVNFKEFGAPASEANEYELDPNILYGPSASYQSGIDARTEIDPRSAAMNGGYVPLPQDQVRRALYTPPEKPFRPEEQQSQKPQPIFTSPQPIQENPKSGGEDSTMIPFVKEMKDAVMSNNKNYYETLREFIMDNTSEDNYAGLLDGRITLDQILNKYRMFTGNWIIEPTAKNYFTEFLSWLRAQQVYAECSQCGDGLIFNSRQEFELNNLCQNCSIPLVESVVK